MGEDGRDRTGGAIRGVGPQNTPNRVGGSIPRPGARADPPRTLPADNPLAPAAFPAIVHPARTFIT